MNFLKEFLQQKVPKTSRDMPGYYRRAIIVSEVLLAVYFLLNVVLFICLQGRLEPAALALLFVVLGILPNVENIGMRLNLAIFTAIVALWCGWYVAAYGWNYGAQHLLAPVMLLAFFNIYEAPLAKIGYFLFLLVYRMALFTFAQNSAPFYELDPASNALLQLSNTATCYFALAVLCMLFSTNTQDAERSLRLANQELYKEAGTDPLTELYNRRGMLDIMEEWLKTSPGQPFCVAIADIDFFKKVNDTYGHNCGDYALKSLANLFAQSAEKSNYMVCRWGGEEFCFFMPNKNLDEAGSLMIDLNVAVCHMPLNFEGIDFSVTITAGVEEYDFLSPLTDVIQQADEKLYIGKNSGRNQVVI